MQTQKHLITWSTEHLEGPCSDVIKYLAASQFSHTTVSYTLIGQDKQKVEYSLNFQFEKPSVAAKKINQFMHDPASLIEPDNQKNHSDR